MVGYCILFYQTVDLKVKVMTKDEQKHVIVQNDKTRYISWLTHIYPIAPPANTTPPPTPPPPPKLRHWTSAMGKQNWRSLNWYELRPIQESHSSHIWWHQICQYKRSNNIKEIDDIQNINIESVELEDNIVKGQCIGIDVKKTTCCIVCNTTWSTCT